MIIALDILLAFAVALIFSAVLSALLGRKGPGPFSGRIFFLVLLFLGAWAGGIWSSERVAATWAGAAWLAIPAAGLVIMLLLAALSASGRRTRRPSPPPAARQNMDAPATRSPLPRPDRGAAEGLGFFFWLLSLVLLGAAIAHYAWYG